MLFILLFLVLVTLLDDVAFGRRLAGVLRDLVTHFEHEFAFLDFFITPSLVRVGLSQINDQVTQFTLKGFVIFIFGHQVCKTLFDQNW